MFRRRDEVISGRDDSGQLPWLEERGIELFRGEARLEGERRVWAANEQLVARKAVVIATGTVAAIPPIDGLAEAEPWTNREATNATQVPDRLIVLGGGAVGVEMAQAYASLGSSVVLVEAEPRVVPNLEEFASDQIADGLRASGVEFLVIPRSVFGWRDRHPEFVEHLKRHHRFVTRQESLCEIYAL